MIPIAILFSQVKVQSADQSETFLISGIPKEYNDLTESVQLEWFLQDILNEYQELPDENDLPNEFSSEFQIWSQKLIRKTHNPYWYYVNTTVKKVILIAIILSMMTMTALAVPSIREAIIDFFFHNHGERYGITFNPEEAAMAPETIETVMFPSFVPKDLLMVDQNFTTGIVYGFWTNDNSEIVRYTQTRIPAFRIRKPGNITHTTSG